LDHTARVDGADFSPDGQLCVTAAHDGQVRLWRGAGRPPLRGAIRRPRPGRDGRFTPPRKDLAVVWPGGRGRPFALPPRRAVGPAILLERPVIAAALTPDRTLFATTERGVWLFDAETGQARTRLWEDKRPIRAAALAPDGRTFAVSLWRSSQVHLRDADA